MSSHKVGQNGPKMLGARLSVFHIFSSMSSAVRSCGAAEQFVFFSGLYAVALWKIGENGTVWAFHGFSNGALYDI